MTVSPVRDAVLVLNAGSSSVKFRVADEVGTPLLQGSITGLGTQPVLVLKDADGARLPFAVPVEAISEHEEALDLVLQAMARFLPDWRLHAAGHRVVHGGTEFSAPVLITAPILDALDALRPLAPLHQPHNLSAIRALARLCPDLPQVACFDTAFHSDNPRLIRLYGLPRELSDQGIIRYGFHGLSYQAVAERMPKILGRLADRRVLVAHLGNGASLCAMVGRKSIVTTMGFTAVEGLIMGTRCGRLDPGIVLHLIEEKGYSLAEIGDLLYKKSGLLGISGLSNDMRTLLASSDPHAQEAVDLFVHRILREIGSLAMVTHGLDAIVFTAGIGENAPEVRARVLAGLAWLGVEIDHEANSRNSPCITTEESTIAAFVVPTDEEAVIVAETLRLTRDLD